MSALAGKRIVITRASHQAGELERLLLDRDAIPLLYPCIAIKAPQDTNSLNRVLQAALDGAFDWLVLTSSNTVGALKQSFDLMGVKPPYPLKLQVAAVGSKTAHYAGEQLGVKVSIVPEQHSASTLANALPSVKNARVLLPQSKIAEPILATTLSDMGAIITTVTAYQTVIGSGGVDLPAILTRGDVDAITFTSASTVNNLLQRLQNEGGDAGLLAELCIACIGTTTANAARQNHLPIIVMPDQHTLEGLVTTLEHYYVKLAIGESE
jgi:uroporphyrinogen-III synthase